MSTYSASKAVALAQSAEEGAAIAGQPLSLPFAFRSGGTGVFASLAWVGFGVYAYVVNRHALDAHGYSDRIARYELGWSIETALVVLIGAAAGILLLRRSSSQSPPTSIDQPVS